MSDEEQEEIIIEKTGLRDRKVPDGHTFLRLTQSELVAVIQRRAHQLNSPPDMENPPLARKVRNLMPRCGDVIQLAIAEIFDASVPCPILVKRGDHYYRLHSELKITQSLMDKYAPIGIDGVIDPRPVTASNLEPLYSSGNARIAVLTEYVQKRALENKKSE